jgi:hypothetical protein
MPRTYVPIRQPLWTGGYEVNFERTQSFERLVHVAHYDRDMLKPEVVALGVFRNRPIIGTGAGGSSNHAEVSRTMLEPGPRYCAPSDRVASSRPRFRLKAEYARSLGLTLRLV